MALAVSLSSLFFISESLIALAMVGGIIAFGMGHVKVGVASWKVSSFLVMRIEQRTNKYSGSLLSTVSLPFFGVCELKNSS